MEKKTPRKKKIDVSQGRSLRFFRNGDQPTTDGKPSKMENQKPQTNENSQQKLAVWTEEFHDSVRLHGEKKTPSGCPCHLSKASVFHGFSKGRVFHGFL